MSRATPYVRLLGEPELESSAGRHAFRSDKRYFLLAYLACHDGWVDRARLARLFWPELDAPAARHNLRQLLKRTTALKWRPVVGTGSGPDGERLQWSPATDLDDLYAALSAKRWAQARSLHRGRLLEGLRVDAGPAFETWLERHRQSLEDKVRLAFMNQGAALAEAGEHAEAARLYAHLVDAESYDEEALRYYMMASFAVGEGPRALAAYQRFTARLADELGLAPTAATESVAQGIRSGALAAGSPSRRTTPLAADAHRGRGSLPHELIGRELELSDVHRLLANPGCRLLTITGPGGVGKSALARQAAIEVGPAFSHGVVYVALDVAHGSPGLLEAIAGHPSLTTPAAAIADQAATVANPAATMADPTAAIGERRLLLVLDDLDEFHGEANQLPRLLQCCPNLKIIATTRERLIVEGEWTLPLDGLPFPAATATPAEVTASDAVSLFVAHAGRFRPDYYLTDAEAGDVARVCRSVAGLPLAIELAASWTRVLPTASIADEIGGGLDVLSGGPRGTAARHASMRASVEHSWRRLSSCEQRAWRALAVFDSPFDRVAARRVAAVELPMLASLVDKSLLRAVTTGRLSFHPLLHAFAVERLNEEPADLAELRESHAWHFLSAVNDADDHSGSTHRTSIDAVEASLDDVASAWRWAVSAAAGRFVPRRPPSGEELNRWCSGLAAICDERAWYSLAITLFEQAITALEGEGTEPEGTGAEFLGNVLAQHGWHLLRLGSSDDAEQAARRAVGLLSGQHGTPAFRTAIQTRAVVALQEGRYGAAEELFSLALESARAARINATERGRRELAKLAGNLGVARQLLGDRRGAAVEFRRELTLLRGIGDDAGTARALSNLGNVLRLLDQKTAALATLEEALRLATDVGNYSVMPSLLINLGVLHSQLGAHGPARRHLEAAADRASEQGRRPLVILAEFQLGRLELELGSLDAARDRFSSALDQAVLGGNPTVALDALAGLAWVESQAGSVALASRLARLVAENRATSPGTRTWAGELLALIGESIPSADDELATAALDERVGSALALVAGRNSTEEDQGRRTVTADSVGPTPTRARGSRR